MKVTVSDVEGLLNTNLPPKIRIFLWLLLYMHGRVSIQTAEQLKIRIIGQKIWRG